MENITYYKSPFGVFTIKYMDDKIIFVKKIGDEYKKTPDTKLTSCLKKQLDEYFAGNRKDFDIQYELTGTEFQKKVWDALTKIPYGKTVSYKHIATMVGNPKASRAVGLANNKNPITIIVPCHRVVGTSGKLVGYAGGLPMKESILDLEKSNV